MEKYYQLTTHFRFMHYKNRNKLNETESIKIMKVFQSFTPIIIICFAIFIEITITVQSDSFKSA